MKVRNVSGPTAFIWPGQKAVPVVAQPDYQRRVGPGAYEAPAPGSFAYPKVDAIGLGADDMGLNGPGAQRYGYSRKLELDQD